MNVSVVDLTPCKKLVKIEFDAEAVRAAVEKTTDQYQKNITIPGFRAGKVPRETVAKLYAKKIEASAMEDLMRQGLSDAIKEQNLSVVGSPRLEEEVQLETGKPFCFNVTVELKPVFDLPEYKGIPVKIEKNVVNDNDVEKALHTLQERMCSYKDVEKAAADGDVLTIDYTATCEGKPLTEIAPNATRIASAKGFWVRIAKDSFLPGFTEQLIGLKAKDQKKITVEFPKNFIEQALAGKQGTFDIQVILVKEVVLPELNDDLAKLYGAKNMDLLRRYVRSDMERNAEHQERQSIETQITNALLEKATFELPDSLLENETQTIISQIVRQNQENKVRDEVIQSKMEEIKANATKQATNNLRITFILSKIAEIEKIKPTDDEMRGRISYLAETYKMPIQKFFARIQENGAIRQIAADIIRGKVMDYLKLRAETTEVPAAKA